MVRSIDSAALAKLRQQFNSTPIIYIAVDWFGNNQFTHYSDKNFDGTPLQGKLLELSGIESILKLSGSGGTQSVSVKLDDTDLSLKTIINITDIHKKKVLIAQWWEGISFDDAILIFEGIILSPIVWSEGERTLSFDVVERLEEKEIGFSPDEATIPLADEEHIGKPWPLGFGTNIRIPAVRLNDIPIGITEHPIAFHDPSIRLKMSSNALKIRQLEQSQQVNNLYALAAAFAAGNMREQVRELQNALDTLQNESDIVSILQSLGELQTRSTNYFQNLNHTIGVNPIAPSSYQLPPGIVTIDTPNNQDASTDVFTPQIGYDTGTINNYNATLSSNADAFADNLGSDQPDLNQLQSQISQLQSAIQEQESQQKSFENKAAQTAVQISEIKKDNDGLHDELTTQEKVGQTTTVIDAWKFPKGEITVKIGEAYIKGSFKDNTFTPIGKPLNPIDRRDEFRPTTVDQKITKGKYYVINPGATVKLVSDYPIYYVVNILPSTIFEVVGHRSTDGGAQVLTPIPASGTLILNDPNRIVESKDDPLIIKFEENTHVTYWEQMQVPFSAGGTPIYDCTVIKFTRAMTCYETGWGDEILVTFKSPVGPNTADIIQWIVQRYTQFGIDPGSFDNVKAQISQFPSNFVTFERKNVMTVLEEICYQARLGLLLKNGVIFLKYLAIDEGSVDTINENDIEYSSLELSFTPTENLVTKFVSTYKNLYENKKANTIILRYNVNKYGSIEKKYDYYIYNIPNCVYQSAIFWLIRKGNTWKKLKFKTFLNKLNIEPMDTVLLNFGRSFVSNGPVNAIVESCKYDSASYTISMEVWVPIRIGEMEPYPFAFPAGIGASFSFPTNQEVTDGSVGNPAHNQLQGMIPGAGVIYSTENTVQGMMGLQGLGRPRDWGASNISDNKSDMLQIRPGDQPPSTPPGPPPKVVTISDAQPYNYREYKPPIEADFSPPKPPPALTDNDGKTIPAYIVDGPIKGIYICDSYPNGLDNDSVRIKVNILEIDPSAIIPLGTAILVTKIKGKYVGQIDVWL